MGPLGLLLFCSGSNLSCTNASMYASLSSAVPTLASDRCTCYKIRFIPETPNDYAIISLLLIILQHFSVALQTRENANHSFICSSIESLKNLLRSFGFKKLKYSGLNVIDE